MTRSDLRDPENGFAVALNVFVGDVVGVFAHLGGRAWLGGNTYIAGFIGICALIFVGLVLLSQVSDWAYWRGETPEILDPKKRAKMSRFRLYSLPIGFGVGLLLPFVWFPEALARLP